MSRGLPFRNASTACRRYGVAATPFRLNAVEAFIKGKPRDKATADQAADMAVEGAVPLQHNAYKIPLMKALVKRAIRGDAEWTS